MHTFFRQFQLFTRNLQCNSDAMNAQRQKLKLQQKLTPQQLILMKMLQLPATQIEQRLKEEIEKNPLLELEEDGTDDDFEKNSDDVQEDDRPDFEDSMDDYFDDDDDYSYRERQERDHNETDTNFEYSGSVSFSEYLIAQLGLHRLTDRQRRICMELIGSIDDSGYLGRDIQLIANDLAFRSNMEVSDDEMMDMLKIIQSMEPAGVGARDLRECLLLQLDRIDSPDRTTTLARTIVKRYFHLLTSKRYDALAAQLEIDMPTLNAAMAAIRRLNPKPGWGNAGGGHYIVPDFIVMRDGDNLSFVLGRHTNPKLKLNSEYAELLNKLETTTKPPAGEKATMRFIREKTADANNLIYIMQQRENTLYNTMAAIIEYQRAFFLSGSMADLHPMRLKDISEITGYDESTISRVVTQKYVQCEFGTFLLKILFSKAIVTEDGGTVASDSVKSLLKQIIENEDKTHPLTDAEISAELHRHGVELSRRTVTKYRESLGIAVGRMRKDLGGHK